MSSNKPLVSIGMCVYNEQRHLPEALDSLLTQELNDFELIIVDNGSDDATRKICLDYANRDSRIQYHRNNTNLGAIKNFNRAFQLSSGKYFMWAAGHDIWAPTLISRCVEIFMQEPSVVLCYPQAMRINSDGEQLGTIPGWLDTRPWGLVSRFNLVIWGIVSANAIYGLIRSDALRRTRLFRNTIGPDLVLLAELSLIGMFAQIPEPLYYCRKTRGEENREQRTRRWVQTLYSRNNNHRIHLPYWRLTYEHLLAARLAPVDFQHKAVLIASVILCFGMRFGMEMILDLRNAARLMFCR